MPINTSPESEFATAVAVIVANIPPGRVLAYGDIARMAGYPRHARFVGRLMGQLPNRSTLPWWRVIRSDGRSGLPGAGAEKQLDRLREEGVSVLGGRVDLARFRWHP